MLMLMQLPAGHAGGVSLFRFRLIGPVVGVGGFIANQRISNVAQFNQSACRFDGIKRAPPDTFGVPGAAVRPLNAP